MRRLLTTLPAAFSGSAARKTKLDGIVAPLLEPGDEGGPAFARARDPQAFRALLAARLANASAADLEGILNDNGVPAARVRTLREFTAEAVRTGLLQPVTLGEGDGRATTPGLGWRTSD